jgi:hypothetical protein
MDNGFETGGYAFPKPACEEMHAFTGMTLRDYFAAAAMQGIVVGVNSNPLRAQIAAQDADREGITITKSTAAMAYDVADAMIAERSKQ